MRRMLPLMIGLSFLACQGELEPEIIYDSFDVTLHLNLAGDDNLIDDLDTLRVTLHYTNGKEEISSWDWFDSDSALVMEEIERGESVVFLAEGLVGTEIVASGQSEPVDVPGEGDALEVWILFRRHGAFLQLEGGSGEPRMGHAVFAVDGGAVVVGGETGDGYASISQLAFSEEGGFTLEDVAPAPGVSGFGATKIRTGEHEGQLLFAGGADSYSDFDGLSDLYHVWDPVSGEYTAQNENMLSYRFMGTATALGDAGGDGKIVFVGGIDEYEDITGSISFSRTVESLDPVSGVMESVTVLSNRWLHSAVSWGPDVTVFCGGYDTTMFGLEPSTGCSSYTASDNNYSRAADAMVQGRAGHGATVIPGHNGDRILVVGGTTTEFDYVPTVCDLPDLIDEVLDTVEIIEQVSGEFVSTDGDSNPVTEANDLIQMNHPRLMPLVLRLPDENRVLVCGGYDGSIYRNDCEFFIEGDSPYFTVAEGLELPLAVSNLQGAVLDDGSVLLVGGHKGGCEAANQAVLYTP